MSDLQQLVIEVTKEVEESDFVRTTIKKHLEKSIEETLANMFRSYGTFGNALKEKLEEELVLNLKNLSVNTYGEMMLKHIKTQLNNTALEKAIPKIDKLIGKYLTQQKQTTWKLSEIIEAWRVERVDYDADNEDEFGLEINEESMSKSPWYRISWGEKPGRTTEYKYIMTVYDGVISGFTIDGYSFMRMTSTRNVNQEHNVDQLLLNLFVNQCTIVVDEVNTSWHPDRDC